jgi:hypothetical protein
MEDRGSIRGRGSEGIISLFSAASRPALGPIQPPVQWVRRALSLGVKRSGRKLTTHLRLVPRLRMSAAIPPLILFVFIVWGLTGQWIRADGVVLG